MARLPLYHQTAQNGRGGIPGWWFGAPVVAFLYALATPRILPDLVSIPDDLPTSLAGPMRWLVGLLFGVVLLSLWQLSRWARTTRVPRRS
jgi:hypothetical protein